MTTPAPRRGEIWLAKLDKARPVVVLTRDPMGTILHSVVVAPVTSTIRGLSTEVAIGPSDGIRRPSVANLDNLQLVARTELRRRVGSVSAATLELFCDAAARAIGCRV